ncbi:hypothetical protein ACRRTK_024726 [Alexandromys fortis]
MTHRWLASERRKVQSRRVALGSKYCDASILESTGCCQEAEREKNAVLEGRCFLKKRRTAGLSSQCPKEEQKEGKYEQRSQDHEGCTHPRRQWG